MLTLLEEEQLVRGSANGIQPVRSRVAASGNVVAREQLGLFAQANPIVEQLAALDVNSMTPLEALSRLSRLVNDAKKAR